MAMMTNTSGKLKTAEFTDERTRAAHRVTVRGAKDGAGRGEIYCAEDDFTDGWRTPQTVLMLHGIAERAEIWRPWSPALSRKYRVLRPDLRGFGRSSALPQGFTIADWADDIDQLIRTLGHTRVHLVTTKLGALIGFELAQRRLPWIASLTLAGMLPSPSKSLGPWLNDWLAMVESGDDGVERWAEATMPGRMGNSLPPAAMQWWTRLMGTAPKESVAACLRLLPGIDSPSNPDRVACPTLFLVPGAPAAAGATNYDQRPKSSDLERLRDRVSGSALIEVPADSYHIAATHPDDCARETLHFIQRIDQAEGFADRP